MKWPVEMAESQTSAEPGLAPDAAFRGQVFKLDEEEDNGKSSICCLQGCLAASVVGFSFFVALPTGIILIVLSTSKNEASLLAVGCVLIALPIIILIMVIMMCMNQKRLCCNRNKKQASVQYQHSNQVQVVRTTSTSGESPA